MRLGGGACMPLIDRGTNTLKLIHINPTQHNTPCHHDSGLSAPDAAAQLGNLALRFGSADNVTVVLVVFDHGGDGVRMEEGGREGEEGDDDGRLR